MACWLSCLKKETFDCIVMDINLPGKNGFDLCREFRKFNNYTPVIMLTAFSDLTTRFTVLTVAPMIILPNLSLCANWFFVFMRLLNEGPILMTMQL